MPVSSVSRPFLRAKMARYFSGPNVDSEANEMETHVKQKLMGSRTFGIVEKLGWNNRKLAGRFSLTGSNGVPTGQIASQTAKELREFRAEFECRRTQGLIEAERVRNRLIR